MVLSRAISASDRRIPNVCIHHNGLCFVYCGLWLSGETTSYSFLQLTISVFNLLVVVLRFKVCNISGNRTSCSIILLISNMPGHGFAVSCQIENNVSYHYFLLIYEPCVDLQWWIILLPDVWSRMMNTTVLCNLILLITPCRYLANEIRGGMMSLSLMPANAAILLLLVLVYSTTTSQIRVYDIFTMESYCVHHNLPLSVQNCINKIVSERILKMTGNW